LLDGSQLNTTFMIRPIGDIIVIPEPAIMILFGLGGLLIRPKK